MGIPKVYLWRPAVYVALLGVLGIFHSSVFFEGSGYGPSTVYFLILLVAAAQAAMVLVGSGALSTFLLSVGDAALVMTIVKVSGSSGSPFLVLFPVLSLSGAIVFPTLWALALAAISIAFMSIAVGFGLTIVGNAAAIISTTLLGTYLMRALRNSGLALSVSEIARRRLENLQKAILANIPSGLMSVDSQGRVIQINGVGLKILGRTESEVLSERLHSIIPHLDAQVTRLNTLSSGLESPELPTERPTVLYQNLRSGENLQLGYSMARLTDPQDRSVLGWLVVFQDLTNVLRLEENFRLSQKLAAVGKLAAGIAHEVRNPLASISGSAQLLAESPLMNEDDRKLLGIIKKESARLDTLITDFLDYVRPPKVRLESVDLNQVVRGLVESLEVHTKWLQTGCRIQYHEGQPVYVLGDENRMAQVLMNLALNSSQAGARQVELRVGPGPSLEVWDDGSGIPPHVKARLFEPFLTTKEQGTGLGMATSYRILEAMEARIEVVSPRPDLKENGGTMIRIEFKGVA